MSKKIDYEIDKNINIFYLEESNPQESGIKKLLKLPFLALKYKKFCKKNNIETSLSLMNRPNYINTLSKMFFNKSKIIISERANPSLQYGYKNLLSYINRFLIKFLYPKADLIIANSNGNRVDLIKNFNIKKNIITIHNPFDIEKIQNLSKEKIDFKIEKDDFIFITIGRLDVGKNHQLIIKAFSKLKNINAKLLILGDGELRDDLLNLIENLKLQDKIFLIGFDVNPYKYLSKSDCFIFGSNHEGFPNVLIEALSCGLPIISTDCKSGPREILAPKSDINYQLKDKIEIAEYGILTPIKNEKLLQKAMDIIVKNKELKENYQKIAMQRARKFEKNLIIKKFKEILK